jgi:hypothetical protein
MATPPQQNMNVAAQQNPDMMKVMQKDIDPMSDPQMAEAKRAALDLLEDTGLSIIDLKELGQAAELAIHDKNLYPMFLQKIKELGQEDPKVFGSVINYAALATIATAAKLV